MLTYAGLEASLLAIIYVLSCVISKFMSYLDSFLGKLQNFSLKLTLNSQIISQTLTRCNLPSNYTSYCNFILQAVGTVKK